MNAIETQGLTKSFGSLRALDGLTLSLSAGGIYGLIGPSGAGKTTTLRLLSTLLLPTSGNAWVGGRSILRDPTGVRREIGYLPDFYGVYESLRVWEFLDFYAACYRLPRGQRKQTCDDLLTLIDLEAQREQYVDTLSRGQQQRLHLARALLHDPAVLILDEPAAGLEPKARLELRELLRELASLGKTVLIASHALRELDDLCSAVAILEAGQLRAYGPVEEIARRFQRGHTVTVRLLEGLDEARTQITRTPHVYALEVLDEEPPGLRFGFGGDETALRELLQALVADGLAIYSFADQPNDLEHLLFRLTDQGADGDESAAA